MSHPSKPNALRVLEKIAAPTSQDTSNSLDNLLSGFTSDPLTQPEAAIESRQLYNTVTARSTVAFKRQFERPELGLRFGVNVLLIEPRKQVAFLQLHKRMPKALPPGGEFDAADAGDPLAVGMRELLQETGNDKDVTSSRLYPYRSQLKWMKQPVLDVHTQPSIIKEKPQPWWFLTVGLLIPAELQEQIALPGRWYPLEAIIRVDDFSLVRASAHALRAVRLLNA